MRMLEQNDEDDAAEVTWGAWHPYVLRLLPGSPGMQKTSSVSTRFRDSTPV
jgi:hypothetical protein